MQMNDRYKQMPNGSWYDAKAKRFVDESEVPKTMLKKAEKQKEVPKEDETLLIEEVKSPKSRKKSTEADGLIAKAHTQIAREILTYNSAHEPKKTDAAWLLERGFWYFDRCVELGVTPVPQGLVLALGFSVNEESMLLSGNGGLPLDCREVISAFKQALEMVAEGTLVDSKSGQVGRIFDLKNRFGWKDQADNIVPSDENRFEIKSPEELRKALAKMPGLDLIDEPKEVIVDLDYEVTNE